MNFNVIVVVDCISKCAEVTFMYKRFLLWAFNLVTIVLITFNFLVTLGRHFIESRVNYKGRITAIYMYIYAHTLIYKFVV